MVRSEASFTTLAFSVKCFKTRHCPSHTRYLCSCKTCWFSPRLPNATYLKTHLLFIVRFPRYHCYHLIHHFSKDETEIFSLVNCLIELFVHMCAECSETPLALTRLWGGITPNCTIRQMVPACCRWHLSQLKHPQRLCFCLFQHHRHMKRRCPRCKQALSALSSFVKT